MFGFVFFRVRSHIGSHWELDFGVGWGFGDFRVFSGSESGILGSYWELEIGVGVRGFGAGCFFLFLFSFSAAQFRFGELQKDPFDKGSGNR